MPSEQDFESKLAYARKLGNSALNSRGPKARRMRAEAIKRLRGLTKNLRNRSPFERWQVLRHLYYFNGENLKNYHLGVREVGRGNGLGYLSIGIGAGTHALELLNRKQFGRSVRWAGRANAAWRKLLRSKSERLPNRLCHYARGLALQRKFAEAENALNEAIKTSGAGRNAFRDIANELEKIRTTFRN